MASSTNPQWVTATVLQALARNAVNARGLAFTGTLLAGWVKGELTDEQRVHATSRLCALAFVKHQVTTETHRGTLHRIDLYTLTDDGAAAVLAAQAGHVRKSGPKGSRAPNPVRPTDMASRLWYLLRLRRQIDADGAARVLCDAGGPEFERVRATVAKTLRRWKLAGAVEEGARRVHAPDAPKSSNGFKRYVLVNDSGPTPPRWRPVVAALNTANNVNKAGQS